MTPSRFELTPAQEIEVEPTVRMIPLYFLVLHNNTTPSMDEVVDILFRHTPLNEIDSTLVMLDAHNTGIGVVMIDYYEAVEYYSETLRGKGLITSIEPA